MLLNDASVIYVGWGKENDVQVLWDTLGFEFVDKFEKRVFMSNLPGNFQLHQQIQYTDVQKVFAPSHVPTVAGYDGDEDLLNVPKNVKLDVCAWTVLCMAVNERFCAAILQDAIYKHHLVGDTELKLFLYHDEALNLDRMIYAPTNADRRREVMEHRGLWRWHNVPHAMTLAPNRQCWEAVLKWMAIDGPRNDYCLKIRDRTYDLSRAVSNLKGSMSKMTDQWVSPGCSKT